MEKTQEQRLIDLLWESLRKDPEHSDRRQTGWGTKTKTGLVACIERITQEKEFRWHDTCYVKEVL